MSTTVIGLIVGTVLTILAAFVGLPWLRGWVRQRFSDRPYVGLVLDKGQNSIRALLFLLGVILLLNLTDLSERSWSPITQQTLEVLLIAALTWLFTAIAIAFEEALTRRTELEVASGRKFYTQITMLRRILVAVIVTVGAASILMTFPAIKVLGEALFVSAGVFSIIIGLAAQTTLTNTFAGIQIALTNALRVDDFVSVEGQAGRVADITLTYVVIQIWDERRVVYPTSFFMSNSFENWTRSNDIINGSVTLDVDWAAPFDELRVELDKLLQRSSLWDGRDASLNVVDAEGGHATIQIRLSAASVGDLFALREEVLETMIRYMVQYAPEGQARTRYEKTPPVVAR